MTAPRQNTASLTISIDLELAWGDRGKERYRAMHNAERVAIDGFLKLCDTFDIPCTWATVGNLFLRESSDLKKHGVVPIGRGIPAYSEWINDSNSHLWFGADIIERILASKTSHEIASHTFFHTLVSEIDETGYETELNETRRIAYETFGLELTSFVYPSNEGGYQDALFRAGYTHFRGNDVLKTAGVHSSFLKTILNAVDEFGGFPIPDVTPVRLPNGLWSLPGSYFFPKVLRANLRAPLRVRVYKCIQGLKHAMLHGTNVHLWFHPHNIAIESEYWLSAYASLFKYVSAEREHGRLKVHTMRNLVS